MSKNHFRKVRNVLKIFFFDESFRREKFKFTTKSFLRNFSNYCENFSRFRKVINHLPTPKKLNNIENIWKTFISVKKPLCNLIEDNEEGELIVHFTFNQPIPILVDRKILEAFFFSKICDKNAIDRAIQFFSERFFPISDQKPSNVQWYCLESKTQTNNESYCSQKYQDFARNKTRNGKIRSEVYLYLSWSFLVKTIEILSKKIRLHFSSIGQFSIKRSSKKLFLCEKRP